MAINIFSLFCQDGVKRIDEELNITNTANNVKAVLKRQRILSFSNFIMRKDHINYNLNNSYFLH
jgi:hypothetical protein